MKIQNEEAIWGLVDAKKEAFVKLADQVFDTPETLYKAISIGGISTLESEGFKVTENICGMPTAVIIEAGDEGPIIAILGEFDALPGLSQQPGVAEYKPIAEGGELWLVGIICLALRHYLPQPPSKTSKPGLKHPLLRLPCRGRWCSESIHGA